MVRIRHVDSSHLPAILIVEDECFGTERFPLECFRGYLRRANSVFLVAEDGDGPAGYVLGAVDSRYRPPIARLDSIAVRKAWRRQGLGRRLLERFEDEVRRSGAAVIALEVEGTNRGARRLYRQAGYRVEGDLPDYYGPDRHGVRLVKQFHA